MEYNKKENAFIPMERYNQLLQVENAMNSLGSDDGNTAIVISNGYWGAYYTIKTLSKQEFVTTANGAINRLQSENFQMKESVRELEIIKKSFLYKIFKWAF